MTDDNEATGQDSDRASIDAAAERVLSLEEELETSGDALTSGIEVERIRALLHQWVDGVVGAVSSPGVGRVTLIHDDGSQSKIACPRLPFVLSRPAKFD
jgi:hypothetical protein